jgi:hypothetical protein
MNLPSVIHPKKFNIKGMLFEIVAYKPLTDDEAAQAAMYFYRSHKFKKADQGKLFHVLTQFGLND